MPDDRPEPRAHWLTVALALVTALAYEVGRSDGGDRLSLVALFLGIAFGVALLHVGAVWLERRVRWTDRFGASLVLGIGLGTIGFAYLQRAVWGTGLPFELILVACLRNSVLGAAVLSYEPSFRRSTAILGTFTIVFSTALTTDPLFYGLVVLYAVLGVWWLMGSYWSTLKVSLLPASERHRPTRWMLALPVVVAGCLLAMPLVARDTTRALMGIAPSSGGTGSHDPFARDGVGNGDMLVAGEKDIQSFAPIDDAPFLNSHEPSLYDCFDETYDEPFIPKKTRRAIALPKEALADLRERHLAKSEKASREFSTLRKQPGASRREKVDSIRDDALLFIAGRVPVHLRLAVYDVFDGTTWHEEPMLPHPPSLRIEERDGKPWLQVQRHLDRDEFPQSVTHAIKFVNLRSNRIPAPPNTLGLHIDEVDRSDMFEWAQPSIVRLLRKRVPPLLVAHAHSAVVDRDALVDRTLAVSHPHRFHGLVPSDAESERITRLAEEWVTGMPRGWPQVERITERLRTEYVLDPDARPPGDTASPVAHFLFESRRGPDYQFATAAVLMLRSLGYSARFVSGFYADPDDYDPRSRHTPIRADDVHVWAEVDVGARTWVTVEATPGHVVPGPTPSLFERASEAVLSVLAWGARNAIPLCAILAVSGLAFWFRANILDRVRILAWTFWPPRNDRTKAPRAWGIVEGRLRSLGYRRPAGRTPRVWVTTDLDWLDDAPRGRLLELLRLAEWSTFSRASSTPTNVDLDICDRVVLEDTRATLRRTSRRADVAPQPTAVLATS